jgi:gliding motility-associated-like protein
MDDFEAWSDVVSIEPFELKDVCPGTLLVHNIHLKSDQYVLSAVKNNPPRINDELTIINYPNPFNSSTNFFIKIPDGMKGESVNIRINNAAGQLIKKIRVRNGTTVSWDGKDMAGNIIPSGAYYYRMNINEKTIKSGSMILLR